MRFEVDEGPVSEVVHDRKAFFLYGWAPGERRIDAAKECSGTEKIHSIRTRGTFLEGLVAAVAGY